MEEIAIEDDGDVSWNDSSPFLEESIEKLQDRTLQKNTELDRDLKTLGLALGFFNMGYDLILYGQTLPTLAENLKKSISELSAVLIARGAGFLSGSLSIGLIDGKLDTEYSISLSLAITSVGLFFIPTILNYATLIIFSFVCSFGFGAFETVGNVQCFKLWGDRGPFVLQALHFFFCLGSVTSPLTTEPFLNEARNTTFNNGSEVFRDVIYVGDTNLPYLSVIYIIIASIGFLTSIFILFLKFFYKTVSNVVEEETEKQGNKFFRYKILVLMFSLFLFYVGMYISFSTFFYTFAVSDTPETGYSKGQALDLNTVYLVGYSIGSFLSILMAKKFSSTVNITLSFTVAFFVSIGFLLLPYYSQYKIIFWILLAIHGLCLPGVDGFFYSWANEYIVVNDRASSVFIVGGSCGEMVLPLLLGLYIDGHPMYFLYAMFLCIFFLVVLFLLAVKVARNHGPKTERNETASNTGTEEILLETEV